MGGERTGERELISGFNLRSTDGVLPGVIVSLGGVFPLA